MKKHFAVFKIGLQDSFTYRSESVVWMFVEFMPILMLSFVWLGVFETRAQVGGYSKEQLITYYIGSLLIGRFVSWYIQHDIAEEIRYGGISSFLLKPYSYLAFRAISNGAWRFQRFVILTPFFIFILLNFKQEIYLNRDLFSYILIAFALLLALFLYLSISFLLGFLAFWFQKVDGLYNLYWVLRQIFSGAIIPLTLLPGKFLGLARILPFRYTFSFPLEIYFSRARGFEIMSGFFWGIFWLVITYFLVKLLWREGLKRYASFGG